MQLRTLTSPILIPAVALLLLAAAVAVGYQAVSAQSSPGSLGGDTALENK